LWEASPGRSARRRSFAFGREAPMSKELEGKRIAFLATNAFEEVELTEPWKAVEQAGGRPELVSQKPGEIYAVRHHDRAGTYAVDHTVDQVTATEYDGLMLPGGVANPDALRMDERAVRFVKDFFEQSKPVAAICHAPWMLVEADQVRGRTVTSWPSLQTDIRNAGGVWVDEEVRAEDGLVTSRKPDDLPAFCARMIEAFAAGEHAGRRVA
jgi:protease I